MAKKKKSSKSPFGSKSDFVRGLDPKTPAKKVVELAKSKGISLTPGLVYNIRSAAKLSVARVKGVVEAKVRGMSSAETQLRDAIADLGLVKATEILESVKRTIRQR